MSTNFCAVAMLIFYTSVRVSSRMQLDWIDTGNKLH